MAFVGNPTRQRKSKEPLQLRLLFEWFLKEILLDHAIQFWLVLEWFWKNSYLTTKIQATFPISTRFLMVFVWSPIKPRKSKQPFQFSLVSEWLLKEILPDHAKRSNLFNFDQFLNVFMKSY